MHPVLPRHQPALDGLRGVAIGSVVAFHAFGYPRDGFLGVDLFFVLSGFLITTLLLDERRLAGRVSFRAFYRRRALRLLPALFAFLGIYLGVTVTAALARGDLDSIPRFALGAVIGATYLTNLLISAHGQGVVAGGLTQLWSLAAEEQFYLVWPPLLFLVFRARRRIAIEACALGILLVVWRQFALAVARAPGHRLDFGVDTRGGSILVGCLAALLLSSRARPAVVRVTRLAAPFAAALVAWLIALDLGRLLYVGPLTIFGFCAAVVIVDAIRDGSPLQRVLGLRPLVFVGKISYPLYLWHPAILVALSVNGADRFAAGGPARKLTAIALSVVAATCSYYFVERPFLRRKRSSLPVAHAPATSPLPAVVPAGGA